MAMMTALDSLPTWQLMTIFFALLTLDVFLIRRHLSRDATAKLKTL